ncbi:MAG: HK97 gp10 family phage protein [Xanthobacteraceae bacterium]|nr:HK97 gp10 family phage protein [Xanthobacteraceae bacterium]
MANEDGGLASFQRRMAAIPKEVRAAVKPALLKSGEELRATMRQLAEMSRDTGDLIDSIAVTGPGETTPPYSQPGGSQVVGETSVAVTVGDSSVRYAHLVEYGTAKAPAQPFFWPAFRLHRTRITRRIKRAINKAVKESKAK